MRLHENEKKQMLAAYRSASSGEAAAVAAYRATHPMSRAVRGWALNDSSSLVRRATCIHCRSLIATCSGRWPETIAYRAAIVEHVSMHGSCVGGGSRG